MKKDKMIFRIFKHLPINEQYEQYGKLVIEVDVVDGQHYECDRLTFKFQCNMNGEESTAPWYGMDMELKVQNFEMLPLLRKMSKILKPQSPEEIVQFLIQEGVQQGTYLELSDAEGKGIFHGFVSASEIQSGRFVRGDKQFTINPNQMLTAMQTLANALDLKTKE
jgi:hypothetical protein